MSDVAERSSEGSVHIFLDESGTSAGDEWMLVGATAFQDVQYAEGEIRHAFDRAIGDDSLWPDVLKRERFGATGFHFTEDSDSVRQVLLSTLDRIDFRAYVAFARNDVEPETVPKLVNMYGVLLQSLTARYRTVAVDLVFEQNPQLDDIFGRIWEALTIESGAPENVRVLKGTKRAPCLAATDYVLGLTRLHVAGGAQDYQERRFAAVGRHMAYLVDFDDDKHFGGRKHPIL